MIRRISEVLGRAVLALILAVLVWVIAIQESDPTRLDTYPDRLPVILLHQPADTMVYGASSDKAQVVLRAPGSVWDSLETGQISVTLDLANQPYGEINVPLKAHVQNDIVQVVRVEPASVKLYLERALTQYVPVRLALSGEPALGYTIRSSLTLPSEVAVFGPASRVERVKQVRGTMSVQDKRQSLDQTISLKALDEQGVQVEGVTLSPEVVQARVVLEQLGGFRDLAVRVVITGQVASGYRISNINVSPVLVTIFGSSQAIDGLPGYVETVPVNVENAQGHIAEQVALNLPGGISLLGESSVQVDVSVEAIQSGLTLRLQPVVLGLAPLLEARVSPEYVDLVLTGPLPRLQTLEPGQDVRVVVDVAALEPGTYQVVPRVIVPEGVVAESILPSTIQVTIAPAGTLSPLATPTPADLTPAPSPTP